MVGGAADMRAVCPRIWPMDPPTTILPTNGGGIAIHRSPRSNNRPRTVPPSRRGSEPAGQTTLSLLGRWLKQQQRMTRLRPLLLWTPGGGCRRGGTTGYFAHGACDSRSVLFVATRYQVPVDLWLQSRSVLRCLQKPEVAVANTMGTPGPSPAAAAAAADDVSPAEVVAAWYQTGGGVPRSHRHARKAEVTPDAREKGSRPAAWWQ